VTVTYSGRVEAQLTIPTGGASISATIPNGAGVTAVTLPAGSYFYTQAGGVSSLLGWLSGVLNNGVQGYPQTAVAMNLACVAGTWVAGYLMNETSGSLAPVFGATSLTAVSSPVYANAGPRGGIDYAISFDSNADAFSGGDVYDVTAANDMCWAAVVNLGTATTANMISKGVAGVGQGRIVVYTTNTNSIVFEVYRASDGALQGTCTITDATLFGGATWCAVMAVIDRSTGKMRLGVCPLGGSPTVSAEATIAASDTSSSGNFLVGVQNVPTTPAFKMSALYVTVGAGVCSGMSASLSTTVQNFANAINASWSVSLSSTTGLISIGWTGYATPTWSIFWTSTDLRDLLGFTANISSVTTTQTGTKAARGCWLPDCPLYMESDPTQAPRKTDLRQSESPTGITLGLAGNSKYRHKGLRWNAVPQAQVWESKATYQYGSWEAFCKDAIFGLGHSWFVPSSRIQVYFDSAGTATALGSAFNSNAGVSGWFPKGIDECNPPLTSPPYMGLYRIEIPEVVTDG
jgi:hypothetical protein